MLIIDKNLRLDEKDVKFIFYNNKIPVTKLQ